MNSNKLSFEYSQRLADRLYHFAHITEFQGIAPDLLKAAAALAQQAQPDECEALIFAEKAIVNGNYYPYGCEPHLTVIRRMMQVRLSEPDFANIICADCKQPGHGSCGQPEDAPCSECGHNVKPHGVHASWCSQKPKR